MNILLIVNFKSKNDPFNVSGVEYHRLLIPFINLAKTYGVTLSQLNEINPETTDLTAFDLVVFSRVLSSYGKDEAVLQALQKASVPFIVDVDDYWILPTTHVLYKSWVENKMQWKTELALKHATAVITTTPHLATCVHRLNKNIVVATNAIDPEQPQFIPQPTESDTARIGWVGGLCHTDDIPLLQRGFERLYSDPELTNKFSVNLCGFMGQNFDVWAYYEYIFTAGQKRPNYNRVPGRDIRQYATLYNDLDICLVPLADTTFNRCKSELKMIEAGWFGLPVIASQVYPYTLMGQHGKNCLFVQNNKIDWHKYMKKLINSRQAREDIGGALRETVQERYMIDKVNPRRMELINSIIKQTVINI